VDWRAQTGTNLRAALFAHPKLAQVVVAAASKQPASPLADWQSGSLAVCKAGRLGGWEAAMLEGWKRPQVAPAGWQKARPNSSSQPAGRP